MRIFGNFDGQVEMGLTMTGEANVLSNLKFRL